VLSRRFGPIRRRGMFGSARARYWNVQDLLLSPGMITLDLCPLRSGAAPHGLERSVVTRQALLLSSGTRIEAPSRHSIVLLESAVSQCPKSAPTTRSILPLASPSGPSLSCVRATIQRLMSRYDHDLENIVPPPLPPNTPHSTLNTNTFTRNRTFWISVSAFSPGLGTVVELFISTLIALEI